MTFHIGDKVKVVCYDLRRDGGVPVGLVGTICQIRKNGHIYHEFKDDETGRFWFVLESELELVERNDNE